MLMNLKANDLTIQLKFKDTQKYRTKLNAV